MKTISNFIYESDGIIDSWRVLKGPEKRGDCDDYAITTIYENENRVVIPILSGKYKLHFVRTSDGGKHVVLQCGNLYIDNITQKWVTKDKLPYDFVMTFPRAIILIKLLLGRIK